MHRVEQAVFASLETDQGAGYRVVAKSDGVCDADERALGQWGAAHDSLLASAPDAESFNFHPLPSGAHCVSRTVSAGWNRSCGKQGVATQCLIVLPDVLARFGNNPFALIHAASAAGAWQVNDMCGPRLDPLSLAGGVAPIDQALLAQLATDPGPANMAALVQAARDASLLAVSGTPSPVQLIAGLFSCLPPECRPAFSFSTGLKFSPRRPFRIVALSGDEAERQWVAHYPNVVVLELRRGESAKTMPLDGWAQVIERTLLTGQIAFLAAQASRRRARLAVDDLPALGLQLLEELDASALADQEPVDAATWEGTLKNELQAHAAHRQFSKSAAAVPTAAAPIAAPSTRLDPNSPDVLEKLERLDDLVYEAIGGRFELIEQLRAEWPKIVAQLGEPMLAESREQYLRYALSIWDECNDCNGIRNPGRAIQALEVLCVIFDGVV